MTLRDGISAVTPGKIAAVVTTLEMTQRPAPRAVSVPAGLDLVLHAAPEVSWYRQLFRLVGQDYLWFSHLAMAERDLAAHLASEAVEVWSVQKAGADLGLLELVWMENGDCELLFFGLSPELIGGGVGRWVMEHAIKRAYSRPIMRFFVHTCTLDSPQALGFYIRSGFVPCRREVEVADDPRLIGLLPEDCAPQVPLLRP